MKAARSRRNNGGAPGVRFRGTRALPAPGPGRECAPLANKPPLPTGSRRAARASAGPYAIDNPPHNNHILHPESSLQRRSRLYVSYVFYGPVDRL